MSQKSFTIKIFLGIVFADEDHLFDILYDGCCIQKYYRTQDAETIATKADTF